MDENELEKLRYLREQFEHSQHICDPVDFIYRQQNLLIKITEYLLDPLYIYEENQKLEAVKDFENISERVMKLDKEKKKK